VQSHTTEKFWQLLVAAPEPLQAKARIAFRLWAENPSHPSLRFKKVHSALPIYSARIDLNWRAMCVVKNDTAIWFWIGPHEAYELLLKQL
jgi:hypothetical protein